MLQRVRESKLYADLHRHEIVRQFVKYAIVGAINVVIQLAFFNGLRIAGVHRIPASTVAAVVTSITSFALNKVWSFRDSNASRVHRQYLRFSLFTLVGLAIFTGAFRLLLIPLEQYGRLGENAAFILAIPAAVVWNFTSYRRWTFNRAAPVGSA